MFLVHTRPKTGFFFVSDVNHEMDVGLHGLGMGGGPGVRSICTKRCNCTREGFFVFQVNFLL